MDAPRSLSKNPDAHPGERVPDVENKSFSITVNLVLTKGGAQGIVLTRTGTNLTKIQEQAMRDEVSKG